MGKVFHTLSDIVIFQGQLEYTVFENVDCGHQLHHISLQLAVTVTLQFIHHDGIIDTIFHVGAV